MPLIAQANECLFCHFPGDKLFENEIGYVIEDKYPVSPGHLLIIPKEHVNDWFSASPELQEKLLLLVTESKEWLDSQHAPDGYNVGMNCGRDAGQTVMHLHIHLIPRYRGDMEDPRGGVRGVIPS